MIKKFQILKRLEALLKIIVKWALKRLIKFGEHLRKIEKSLIIFFQKTFKTSLIVILGSVFNISNT